MAAGATLFAAVPAVTLLNDDFAHPPKYPWRHLGLYAALDCGAVRRGLQVYREVCSTCHSLDKIRWRELVGVTHSKNEVKKMAAEVEILDGPGFDGEMFERPSKLYDVLPSPYANEKLGEAANGGAYPPDLSLMVKAREQGHDYVFALLTGYMDPPAGKLVMEGRYYNPYFKGGVIAMPPPLQDEGVEYEDGTIATIAQQARDVVQFLSWTADPHSDDCKKRAALWMFTLTATMLAMGYYKRMTWSPLKARSISYLPRK